jgi:hypothetical protein
MGLATDQERFGFVDREGTDSPSENVTDS